MYLSVIIPVYNEAPILHSSLQLLRNRAMRANQLEIIVVDGGSRDDSVAEARRVGAMVIHSARKGRAPQMNAGAAVAKGNVLYFLHADTHPPRNFDIIIRRKMHAGYSAGCFRLLFDSNNPLLAFYGWCTRFDIDAFRFGDQSLFVRHALFKKVNGYRNDFLLLEDQELMCRLKRLESFAICKQHVTTSARKYHQYGVVRLQLKYMLIVSFYKFGLAQPQLWRLYKKLINRI